MNYVHWSNRIEFEMACGFGYISTVKWYLIANAVLAKQRGRIVQFVWTCVCVCVCMIPVNDTCISTHIYHALCQAPAYVN